MRPCEARLGGALGVIALGALACGGTATSPGGAEPAATAATATREVALYFPGDDGRLHAEPRTLPSDSDPAGAVRGLLEALLRGPQTDGLWPPLELAPAAVPEGADTADADTADGDDTAGNLPPAAPKAPLAPGSVRIGPVYLLSGGTVVVDLEAAHPPAVGSREEQLILFSLVNTVLLNTPEAERLLFLWNGTQPYTFAGHLDTGHALVADRSLIGEPAT